MMRNVVTLGCAALLAIGLSFASFAGSIPDADSDGVPDQFDNCSALANGPLAGTASCFGQEDADQDGYGQPCDYDYNNNGAADLGDLGDMLNNLNDPLAAVFDNNCNGAPDLGDLGDLLTQLNNNPGPSGLACAGTIPCIAQ